MAKDDKKADDLKNKSFDELNAMLMNLRKEQFNLRFQKSGGQIEDTAKIRMIRRDIARVKTFMNYKRREEKARSAA